MDLVTAESLTLAEQSELASLETVIEKGMLTFVEVGRALKNINDKRLYRERYGTFEAYCKERWGIERRTAYNYITASRVVEDIKDAPARAQINFTQAREMARLSASERQQLASEVDFSTATSDDIREIVKEKYPVGKRAEPIVTPPPAQLSYAGKWEIRQTGLQYGAAAADCIVVDPNRVSRGLVEDVCGFTQRHLNKGGSLLFGSPGISQEIVLQIMLDDDTDLLFHWRLAIAPPGVSVEDKDRKIKICWQPVFWFTKGEYVGDTVPDLFPSLKDAVLAITYDGDTICEVQPQNADLAIAILKSGRKYVGICPDATDAERLTKTLQEL